VCACRRIYGLARLHGAVTQRFDAASDTIVIQSVTPTSVGPACVAIASSDAVLRITDSDEQPLSDRIAPSDLQVGGLSAPLRRVLWG
jgi:hypothetical protein